MKLSEFCPKCKHNKSYIKNGCCTFKVGRFGMFSSSGTECGCTATKKGLRQTFLTQHGIKQVKTWK